MALRSPAIYRVDRMLINADVNESDLLPTDGLVAVSRARDDAVILRIECSKLSAALDRKVVEEIALETL
jgi:hypothetical protein